ncbi:MAG TPA: hypothetical protein VF937_15925, partial [Chloroflexota bacterium]
MTIVTGRPSVVFEPAGADGIARLVIDRPDDTVNAVNLQVVEDLAQAVRAARVATPRGLIVVSAKTN